MLSKDNLTIGIYARQYMLSHNEISSLVGERIFPGIAPEGTATPYIIYDRESYDVSYTKTGAYGEEANIVYEVISDDYDEGLSVAVAMYNILQGKHGGFTFDIAGSSEFYKEQKHRQILLFNIR